MVMIRFPGYIIDNNILYYSIIYLY